jgi:hypothetical protein
MHAQVVVSDQFVHHTQSGKTALPKIPLEATYFCIFLLLLIRLLLVARIYYFILPITPHIYSLISKQRLSLLSLLLLLPALSGQVIFEEKIVRLDLAIGWKLSVVVALVFQERILKELIIQIWLNGHQCILQVQKRR